MMLSQDKENYRPVEADIKVTVTPTKRAQAKVLKPRSRGGFNRLLSDVTNSIRNELDERLATKTQDEDANELIAEWVREQKDSQLAKQVAKELDDEVQNLIKRQLADGEAEALKLAIEERRRVQQVAQEKLERESKDSEYAAKLSQEMDENEAHMKEIQREHDELLAKDAFEQLQDEALAEELHRKEEEERQVHCLLKAEASEADEKLAREFQEHFDKESRLNAAKQEEEDYNVALSEQKVYERDYATEKEQQEQKDRDVARKLAIKTFREEHRRKKFRELIMDNPIDASEGGIQKCWSNAQAVIEDVTGGICITVLLPHIKSLQVNLESKRKVAVDATRLVFESETKPPKDSLTYNIDFNIDGKLVALNSNDISYEYCSEHGLLHVYVEKVHLEGEPAPITSNSSINKGGRDESKEAAFVFPPTAATATADANSKKDIKTILKKGLSGLSVFFGSN